MLMSMSSEMNLGDSWYKRSGRHFTVESRHLGRLELFAVGLVIGNRSFYLTGITKSMQIICLMRHIVEIWIVNVWSRCFYCCSCCLRYYWCNGCRCRFWLMYVTSQIHTTKNVENRLTLGSTHGTGVFFVQLNMAYSHKLKKVQYRLGNLGGRSTD